ncbi:hypothetical protein ACFL2T_05675 [Elusimicrobiota bacterium]
MGHAYTPGLKVIGRMKVRRSRMLPIPGELRVKQGDQVKATDIVASTQLPGRVHSVNVANRLGIDADELPIYMNKKEGEKIWAEEALAENKPFISWFKTTIPSPITGSVEAISKITGQVLMREPPKDLNLTAYLDGRVVEVMPKSGVVIETEGSFIQGIFGVGGETQGDLAVAVESPEEELLPEFITEEHKGKIVVGGAHAGWDTFQKAKSMGVSALVVGGIHDKDLRALLGYDIGVAVTGTEQLGFTLIVTEGFGTIPMAKHTFQLLLKRKGHFASASGATQIRAGVMRPEIIIPGIIEGFEGAAEGQRGALQVGEPVRIIREPHFGSIGQVSDLPQELTKVGTESKVRVLEVTLEGGEKLIVPRANIEILER